MDTDSNKSIVERHFTANWGQLDIRVLHDFKELLLIFLIMVLRFIFKGGVFYLIDRIYCLNNISELCFKIFEIKRGIGNRWKETGRMKISVESREWIHGVGGDYSTVYVYMFENTFNEYFPKID